jgi:hypothetical protein
MPRTRERRMGRERLAQRRAIEEPLFTMPSLVDAPSPSGHAVIPLTDVPLQGRINSVGFIPKKLVYASTRDTTSTSTVAVSPETVLFRQKRAPTRYVESDMYFANERGLKTELPDSDLLKALHCYTSDFYSRATRRRGAGNWRSMDETALLALGILMEEATREVLGQTGDLVFTEGQEAEGSNISSTVTSSRRRHRSRRPSKRRRLDEDDPT